MVCGVKTWAGGKAAAASCMVGQCRAVALAVGTLRVACGFDLARALAGIRRRRQAWLGRDG
eukprot:7818528-Lingulodinium_polyedra.AAC.1